MSMLASEMVKLFSFNLNFKELTVKYEKTNTLDKMKCTVEFYLKK